MPSLRQDRGDGGIQGLMTPIHAGRRACPDNFWPKVVKGPECWGWAGAKTPDGYGKLKTSGHRIYAHRLSYEIHHGPIPYGQHVLHRCDNPSCTRPDHLFAGTHSDNMKDCLAKGRYFNQRRTHCLNGHPYSENAIYSKLEHTEHRRTCRKCNAVYRKRTREKYKSRSHSHE